MDRLTVEAKGSYFDGAKIHSRHGTFSLWLILAGKPATLEASTWGGTRNPLTSDDAAHAAFRAIRVALVAHRRLYDQDPRRAARRIGPMGAFWKRFTFWLRIGAVLWVALLGLTVALQSTGLVPDLPKLEPIAWAVSLVIIAGDNVGSLLARWVRREQSERLAEIRTALRGVLIELSKTDDMRFEELGASVWIVPSWRDRHLYFWRPDALKRAIRERPAQFPQKSGVEWTRGKGNVGACWDREATQYLDCRSRADAWSGSTPTQADYNALSEVDRAGLTYPDFVRIAKKYTEVLAEPIWHPTRDNVLIGVLSIDRARRADGGSFTPQLNPEKAGDRAAMTAVVVGRILKTRSQGS
jgi:hypothetical protein